MQTRPKFWRYLGVALVCLGISYGITVIQQAKNAQEVPGTVVALNSGVWKRRSWDHTPDTAPVVEYTVAGQQYRIQGGFTSFHSLYVVGQSVPVLYKIDNPAEAHLDTFLARWLGPLCCIGFGAVFILCSQLLGRRQQNAGGSSDEITERNVSLPVDRASSRGES